MKSEVLPYFEALASTINEAWLSHNYNEDAFSAIALHALTESPPHNHVEYTEIIRWLAGAKTIPHQFKLDESFGQPPITMYSDGRFQIDVLFWHTATTAIHQHGFSGAFAVLGGSSVHSRYEFSLRKKINSRFHLGTVSLRECELLEKGAVREIGRSRALIHSLFHLDTPSVTVVARTSGDPETGPEYVYHVPGVALDPSRSDALMTKRIQSLELLIQIGSTKLEEIAGTILAQSDLHTAYLVLLKIRLRTSDSECYHRLFELARQKHGADVETLASAIEEERRRTIISARRNTISDPAHRFFLALLINLSDRESIYKLVGLRYPDGDVQSLIEQWVQDISATGSIGIKVEGLGALLFRYCLQDYSPEEIASQLAESYKPEELEGRVGDIREVCSRIKQNLFLKVLFA